MKLDYNFIDLSVKKIMEVTDCDLIEGIKIIEILSTRDYIDVTDKYIDEEYSYLFFKWMVKMINSLMTYTLYSIK